MRDEAGVRLVKERWMTQADGYFGRGGITIRIEAKSKKKQ